MQSKYVCLALVAPMTLVLHGCGGDGTTTTGPTGPATTAAPPTTTTTPLVIPSTPWSVADAVRVLNYKYMSFDENNDATDLGVTISMASQVSTFNENLFCSTFMGTQCYQGQADCRMSASLFNHKVLVNGTRLSPTMSRPVGYVFNQDLTESHFGKCAYVWDGNDFTNLNNGCGAAARGQGCGNRQAAFANQCNQDDWDNMHNCTRQDPEIEGRLCKCEPPFCSESYGHIDPPTDPTGETCFYELPALGYQPYDPTISKTNRLRDSVKQRVALQGNDSTLTSTWNEVVIDERLLIPKIIENPANAIWAFVCVITDEQPGACDQAVTMRDEFLTAYNVTGTVPVVQMDPNADFGTAGGPFAPIPSGQIIA